MAEKQQQKCCRREAEPGAGSSRRKQGHLLSRRQELVIETGQIVTALEDYAGLGMGPGRRGHSSPAAVSEQMQDELQR